jgi:hypothetical protein
MNGWRFTAGRENKIFSKNRVISSAQIRVQLDFVV